MVELSHPISRIGPVWICQVIFLTFSQKKKSVPKGLIPMTLLLPCDSSFPTSNLSMVNKAWLEMTPLNYSNFLAGILHVITICDSLSETWPRHGAKTANSISRIQGCMGFNRMTPEQNGRCFADDIFKCIFLNEKFCISVRISLKFVPKGQINNIPALV